MDARRKTLWNGAEYGSAEPVTATAPASASASATQATWTGEAARHLRVLWHRNDIDITASYSYSSDSTITYSSYSDHPTALQYIT